MTSPHHPDQPGTARCRECAGEFSPGDGCFCSPQCAHAWDVARRAFQRGTISTTQPEEVTP